VNAEIIERTDESMVVAILRWTAQSSSRRWELRGYLYRETSIIHDKTRLGRAKLVQPPYLAMGRFFLLLVKPHGSLQKRSKAHASCTRDWLRTPLHPPIIVAVHAGNRSVLASLQSKPMYS
jgi:hypothetical protein